MGDRDMKTTKGLLAGLLVCSVTALGDDCLDTGSDMAAVPITFCHARSARVAPSAAWMPAASAQDGKQGPAQDKALLDPKSNPLAIVYDAYLQTGYTEFQAAALAQMALGYPDPGVEIPKHAGPGVVLLDPKSNPHAIIYDAFLESGHTSEDAGTFATQALAPGALAE